MLIHFLPRVTEVLLLWTKERKCVSFLSGVGNVHGLNEEGE
jgi:hypothetical protein